MHSSVLFDNDETRICLSKVNLSKCDTLVVTFNHYMSTDVDSSGFGEKFLSELGVDVITVKCRNNLWYQDLSLDTMQCVMEGLDYTRIISYGVSMGGYAALFYSSAIKADIALIFSPQYSIDNHIVPWEPRWSSERSSIKFTHPPIAHVAYVGGEYIIVYDPEGFDLQHVDEIRSACRLNAIREIKVRSSGHETIGFLHKKGLLGRLIKSCIFDPIEIPALCNEIDACVEDALNVEISEQILSPNFPTGELGMWLADALLNNPYMAANTAYDAGALCYESGRYADSLTYLLVATARSPSNYWYSTLLSNAYVQTGNLNLAWEAARLAYESAQDCKELKDHLDTVTQARRLAANKADRSEP